MISNSLIQNFQFPGECQKVKVSPDGRHIVTIGRYPPQYKIFDVNNLSLKVSRTTDSDIVDFYILSENADKIVFAEADRNIEFHTKGGFHYKTRIPEVPRQLEFDEAHAELLIAASSPELYRLSLTKGSFLRSYELSQPLHRVQRLTSPFAAGTCVSWSDVHGLVAIGTECGYVECFDPRVQKRVGLLDVSATLPASYLSSDNHLSTIPSVVSMHPSGLKLAVGTKGGCVSCFDLRSSKPLFTLDQGYDSEIISLSWSQQPVIQAELEEQDKELAAGHLKELGEEDFDGMEDVRGKSSIPSSSSAIGTSDPSFSSISTSLGSTPGALLFSSDRFSFKTWCVSECERYGEKRPLFVYEPRMQGALKKQTQHMAHINDVCVYPGSGMFFVARQTKQIQTVLSSTIAPAPSWAASLELVKKEREGLGSGMGTAVQQSGMEMEETLASSSHLGAIEKLGKVGVNALYSDYTFLTPADMISLGLSHLIGTSLLLPYLNGYYIDERLETLASSSHLGAIEKLGKVGVNALYSDYTFLTPADMISLGLSHLIGTSLLLPYLNGYYIDERLVRDAKLEKDRKQWKKDEKERKKKRKEKELSESLADRVLLEEKKRKEEMKQIQDQLEDSEEEELGQGLLQDKRFASLFEDVDFRRDKEEAAKIGKKKTKKSGKKYSK
ncbi:Nucleolar protein 10/Enp2 like protein [Aduncisulcus paluster]|uniref:Nucleolar protein 10/Enp2 like protein n=1 Tax=Aduncisulcus paluster TaxID=2918883 RepID=A0ABQ5KW60_9EUKA|nr:Nucleolar protein 10/Enp2 like protein [Aduncisulcus paluster]